MTAMALYERVSFDFDAKLARTRALLRQAARNHAPMQSGGPTRVSQASSLGAEDMVVTHGAGLVLDPEVDVSRGDWLLASGRPLTPNGEIKATVTCAD